MDATSLDFDFSRLVPADRYKLLTSLVVPRPIALVTTISGTGVVNAAPISFFNVLGDDPPILIISIEERDDGRIKDTSRNIADSGEFVVNLVDEPIVERMHACSHDYPPEVSELDAVGFTSASSIAIRPPRIAEAPAALECRVMHRIDMAKRRLVIGEVLRVHIRRSLVDPQTLRIDQGQYTAVGRFFGNRYVRTHDQFTVDANSYNEAMKRLGRS